jgi:ATP-dependent NAD(P)H-hydrate dehydratase
MNSQLPPPPEQQQPPPNGWEDYREQVMAKCILPLSYEASYKGSSGRVAIIGGNELYVGAPYFAGMAALHTGVDLVSVYTAYEATIPIKSFSPDLMVQTIYRTSDLPDCYDPDDSATDFSNEPIVRGIVDDTIRYLQQRRIHCAVIGPGMGRHPIIMAAMSQIVQQLKNRLYLILDADALYMLSLPQYRHILNGNTKVILTPNQMEYQRLFPCDKDDTKNDIRGSSVKSGDQTTSNDDNLDSATIVQKGFVDHIYHKSRSLDGPQYSCTELGGMKRCGGIGDVLAGTIAAFVTWQVILTQQQQEQQQQQKEREPLSKTSSAINSDNDTDGTNPDNVLLSCYAACFLVKRATKTAFDKKHRAMLAQDVIDEIGPTFHEMMTSGRHNNNDTEHT